MEVNHAVVIVPGMGRAGARYAGQAPAPDGRVTPRRAATTQDDGLITELRRRQARLPWAVLAIAGVFLRSAAGVLRDARDSCGAAGGAPAA